MGAGVLSRALLTALVVPDQNAVISSLLMKFDELELELMLPPQRQCPAEKFDELELMLPPQHQVSN